MHGLATDQGTPRVLSNASIWVHLAHFAVRCRAHMWGIRKRGSVTTLAQPAHPRSFPKVIAPHPFWVLRWRHHLCASWCMATGILAPFSFTCSWHRAMMSESVLEDPGCDAP